MPFPHEHFAKFTDSEAKAWLKRHNIKNISFATALSKAYLHVARNLYIDLKKAQRAHKYYKRVPKAGGGYTYYYTETEYKQSKKGGILSGIMSFFGFKDDNQVREKVKSEYNKHKDKLKGIDQDTFASYLNEYLSNKEKWDKKISGEKKPTDKKIDKKIGKIIKKPFAQKGEKKSGFKLSVMKTIAGIYGNIKKEGLKNEKRERISSPGLVSSDVGRSDVGTSVKEQQIKTAREDLTKKPTKDFLSENFRRTLREHQKDFVNLALENFFGEKTKAMFNMDGTGAGKTLQELALAQTYIKEKSDKPILIVTENKRIIENSFLPDSEMVSMHINHAQNKEDIQENAIYITTYNRLKEFNNKKFGLVIFDESHNLKNKSQKTKNGEQIIDNSDNIGLFSATPLDKGNQIGYIAKSFNLRKTPLMRALGYELESQWTGRETIKIWKAQESAEEIANRIDAMFNDLTKKGFAIKREVPMDNLDTRITNIEMSPEQKEKYNNAEQDFFKQIARNPRSIAAGLMGLRRLTEELKIDSTTNNIVKELKDNPKKQIVLFATRVNDSEIYDEESLGSLREISKKLEEKGIEHVNVFADNKKSKNDIDKFQNGEVRVILTTPQSGGTGLSLDDTEGDRPRKAIVMTPPFSAMEFIQMAGRINRLNTKSKAEVEMYSTDTMTDGWNKDIIANKLLTLGSAVSGDYKKLDIKELDKLQFMSNEDQREYLKNKGIEDQKVPYQEERNISIDNFKMEEKLETEKSKFPKYPLRNISAYETFIPENLDEKWPDAEIGFGKYKGKKLSEIQDRDLKYLRWMLGNIKDNFYRRASYIEFASELTKAFFKIDENIYIDLNKAKKPAPVGTVSKSGKYKKTAEGKWVKITDQRESQKPEENKPKEEKKPEEKPKLDEKNKGAIRNALKKVANILAEVLSGKDVVSPTGSAIEQAGESARSTNLKDNKTPENKDNGKIPDKKEKQK